MSNEEKDTRPLEVALAKQIRVELAERDMTQAQLADRMGVGRVVLSRYLNGHSTFGYDHLIDLADIFDTSLSELMRRAEARLPQ